MKTCDLNRHPALNLLIACAALVMLISACAPASIAIGQPPAQPTATQPPAPTQKSADATQPPAIPSDGIALDLSGLTPEAILEPFAAVPAGADKAWWEPMPAYRRITLQGYFASYSKYLPQIFIYPVAELAAYNPEAAKRATNLKDLLQSHKAGETLPFMPLLNAAQGLHVQVEYMDFKNGKGVRYLTQYSQGLIPLNNADLVYTFQGLTNDGKYYVAAVLPVSHPDLPFVSQVTNLQPAEFKAAQQKSIAWLDQEPIGRLSPDTQKLDAMIQSLEVK